MVNCAKRMFFLQNALAYSLLLLSQNSFRNPVLNMRDGCIERWGGYYYALGTATKGVIYRSKDMVSWPYSFNGVTTNLATWLSNPKWTQASTYTEIGAGDLIYRNGVFHTYFNGIGHCYSPEPMGPYTEQCINEPFDDYGIDVQVFQDSDGEMYWVKKCNKEDPNPMTQAASNITGPEVWTFRMNSPFSRWDITQGQVQLTHQPGHPTSLNHMNFEGPELARYRDRYYLFYAVNRMGPRSGMYEVGCAESDGPMNFNNNKKYPHPILTRNTETQLLRYIPIAPTAEHGGWEARYVTSAPSGDWTALDFDDSSWNLGDGGFGFQEFDLYNNSVMTNARVRARKTFWKTSSLYVRREFELGYIPQNAEFKQWINGSATIYINGVLWSKLDASLNTYSVKKLDTSLLRVGKNVVAVYMNSANQSSTSQQFVDFGIYDTGEEDTPEEIMVNPAQPNFIAGPNGFERWMVYKAFINGVEKQSIDRIHFYGHEPVCEATTGNSPGVRFAPSLPTLANYLDYAIYYPFEFLDDSSWNIRSKVLSPKEDNGGSLVLRKEAEANYRFEVPFLLANQNDMAGVYACYKNESNWVKIELGRSGKWIVTECIDGNSDVKAYDLPSQYEFLDSNSLVSAYASPWHTLTIYKNGERFNVWLDSFELTLSHPLVASHCDRGVVGLTASSSTVGFGPLIYTAGWDEWGSNVTGWELLGNGSGTSLSQDVDLSLSSDDDNNEAIAVKGDSAWNYEFSTYMNCSSLPDHGTAGFYPLWVDSSNYVKAVVNYASKTLDVESKENGIFTYTEQLPLSRKELRQYTFSMSSTYPTSTYTYDLRSESEISGLDILWLEGDYPYLNQTFGLPSRVYLLAKSGDSWVKLDATLEGEPKLGRLNRYTFPSTKCSSLKMVLNTSGTDARAFCVYANENVTAGNFLRARREADGIHIFVNDEEKVFVQGTWGRSRVALCAKGTSVKYEGMLAYQTGAVKVESVKIADANCMVGESVNLEVSVMPENATNKQLLWVSSNPDVVSVDSKGTITRHSEGNSIITAYAVDGGIAKGTLDLSTSKVAIQNMEYVSEDCVYDLNGRRTTELKNNGVYISNGRKYINKQK